MKSKTIKMVLTLSVALNLTVVGIAIGFFLKGKPGPRFPGHIANVLQNISPELTENQQAELRERLKQSRVEGRALHRNMRQQQRAISDVILSDPFDERAAREVFEANRDARVQVQAHMHNQMIEVLKTLSAKQREQFMENLMHAEGRGLRARDKHHRPREEPPAEKP